MELGRGGTWGLLCPQCALRGAGEACGRMSVEVGGEDILSILKGTSAGVSSVPCWASSWPVEGPPATRALREGISRSISAEARAPAPAPLCPLSGRDARPLSPQRVGVSESIGQGGQLKEVCVGCSLPSWDVLPVQLGPGPRYSLDPLPSPETQGGAAASEIATDFRPLAGLAHFGHLPK